MAQEYKSLLTPQNCAVILIDHQPQMAFGVQSIDRQTLINNVSGLALAARIFKVPTIITSVAARSFSGPIWKEITDLHPDVTIIDRTTMNSWEDDRFVAAVKAIGRKKLVIAALWTEVCLAFPALCAIEDGYEVYAVSDASGGTTIEAHNMAMERMIQAGAKPVTWLQVALEFQRDWARGETYNAVMELATKHAGAYGLGVFYAHSMMGEQAGEGGGSTKKKR